MRLRLYLLVLILSSSFLSLLGQSNLLQVTHSVSPDVTICGPNEVFTVDLYNPSPFIMTNTQLEIILPPGLNYVPGSIQNASESNISVLNHPYFNVPDIDTLTYATITFEVNANCDLLNYASSGQILLSLARLDYVANNNNHFDDDQSPSFNALKPNLSIVGVSNQVYSGEIGDVYTRCITITNGGLGSLSEFTFLDEHGSGIQINNVSNGNWSNVDSTETIILTGQDFLSIGDGDTLFENGETIDICETVEILNCISVNSEFTASWGCDAASCQFSTSSANIVFPNLTPDISITSQSDMGVCIGTSSPNLQQLTITNNGLGTAKNVLLEIFQAYGQNNFQNSQRSFIDETSFTMTLNGAPITISIDSTRSNSPNNSCPGTNIGMVYVSLPDILFQDTLIIEWNTYSCCVSGCTGTIYSNGWWYRGTYSNICNSSFVIPQARGRSYSALHLNLINNNSPANMNSGDTSNFSFLYTNFGNSYPKGPDSYYRYEIILPPCLSYTGNIQIMNKDGVSIMNPDSTTINGDTLIAYFDANKPWTFNQAELKFDLTTDCSNCSGGGAASIGINIYYVPSDTCSCEIQVECNSFSTNVSCPGPCSEGIAFRVFRAERTSFGEPDNNEDGLPDGGAATLDFTRVRKDRLMFGDTLALTYSGVVMTDPSFPSWDHCYLEGNIARGDALTFIDAELTIYRSNGSIISCFVSPNITNSGNSRNYKFDLSASTLFSNGCSLGLFSYSQSDSIVVKPRYWISKNLGSAMITSQIDNQFYLSKIPNPTSASDKYQCNSINGLFNIIGYYFTNHGPNTYTVNSCNQIEVTQYYYLSIGPCCGNYGGGNLFRAEYRNWAHIDTMKVEIPNGYNYISSRFNHSRTAGSGSTNTSPWEYPNPLNTGNDTLLIFDVEALFDGYGGTIPLSDDGFHGRLSLTLEPSCEVAGDSAINLVYDWIFAESHYFDSSTTSNRVVRSTHDNLLFEKPQLFIQSTLPIVSALDNTVSWDVNISNVTSFDADHLWLGSLQNSGIQIIDIYDVDNAVSLINNGQIYEAGSIMGTQVRNFKITATYTSCFQDSITILSGWNCSDGYPLSINDYPCEMQSIQLKETPQLPNLVIVPDNPSGTVGLCDSSEYIVEGFNVQLGTAYNLLMNATLPIGMTIIPGTSELLYPDTANFILISDPINISGTLWQWNLSAADSILDTNGLKGLLSPDLNKLTLKFKISTDCNYTSGSTIGFNFSGEAGCGYQTSQEITQSTDIELTGATQPYSTDIVLKSSFISPCSNAPDLTVTIHNNGPQNIGVTDSIRILLPVGVSYIPGSFVGIHNAPQNTAPVQTTFNGGVYLIWNLPNGIQAGDSSVFSFKFDGTATDLSCGVTEFEAVSVSSNTITCALSGTPCVINVITGDSSLPIFVYKSFLDLNATSGFSTVINNSSNQVTVDYSILNNGEDLNPGIPIITHFYDDTDQDGQWSIADQLLATDTFWNGLNFNDSIQLQFTFVSSNTQSCSVIGVIDNLFNPCICDPTEALIPIIPLFNTGPDSSICSMDSIKVGLTSQTGYNYSWSSLQYLSDSTISDPIFYYENQGTQNDTVQLILETNRGNCTTTDSLKIIVYPLPQVQIFGLDSEYCNDYGLDTIQGTPLGGNILGTGLLNDSIIDTKILGPGSFTYEYVYTDQNNCINRDSLSIIVYPNPTVLLQGLNVNYCVSSDNDTLVGTPVGGIFSGAGITDSIFDPQNAGIGNHLISYSYTDTNSCSSLDTQSVVVVGLPVTNILGLENSYCHKDEADTLIGVPAGGVFSGPGISGNIFQPQIADTGWHEIVYSYTDGNSCADSSNFFIRVNSDPVSDFSANNACMYDSIFFTNNSSIANGNIQVYLWDFGNTTSQSTNPSHLFSSDGIHQISLLATSDSGCTDIFQDSIEAYPIPISAFVVDSVCEGNFTHFVSNSSINYGTLQNHTYYLSTSDTLFNSNDSIVINAYGTYNTDLVVSSNQGCSDTSSLSFKVLENPSAEFIAQNVCVYDSMLFNENATINTGAIMNWNWSFGDGNSASLNPINHKYQTPGTYLVSLLVESTSGCKDSIKKTVAVHHVPQSSFTILDICEYDSLIPINNSSITFGNITNYNWDFGNGQTSTDSTDTVHYTSPGSYNIQLISVSDSGCADTINNALQVFEQPTANFTANFVCLNDTTFFQDLTVLNSGFIQSWIWNYAGNTNNNSSFWDIIDSTGTYDISLNVESNHGCLDSITRQIEVFAIPELDIDMKNVCTNDTLIINNTSFISDSSDMFWTWNFDDGSPIIHDSLPIHVYQSSDTFNVSVSALTVNGCAADTIIEIWSYPLPQALFEVDQLCLNDPATIFSDLSYVSSGQISSWLWDFGDGDTSQAQNTSHNYPTAGNYISTLIVASNFGCLDTFQTTLEINEPPIIWFEPDDSEICPNECVTINTNFTPYLSDSIYVLSWKYNDVSFGLNEFNPTICLSESDSYTLELVVITKNQCKDTLIRNSIITVHPSPIAGFEAIPEVTTILDPEINLIDTSKGTASWIWSFGNGTVSDIQMPVVNYEDTGSFMVEQIVQNNFGCTDTAYKEIIVGGDFVVYAPNAFTPDEDGLNDVFNIKGIGIIEEDFRLSIFNRWGDLIYTTTNLHAGWDGKYKGLMMKNDVYVYKVELKDIFNKTHHSIGHFTLVR